MIGRQIVAKLETGPLPKTGVGGSSQPLATALSMFFVIAGSVAFLMVIIGGFKYVVSRGEPSELAKAKDTILYAIVGLVVCLVARSILGLVFGKL